METPASLDSSSSQTKFRTRSLLDTSFGLAMREWAPLHPQRQRDGRLAFKAVLGRVVLNVEDHVARMAVARAAGRIVRTDVKQQEKFQNVPPPEGVCVVFVLCGGWIMSLF